MTNAELMEKGGFSANIITRLKRDNYIALESIEWICHALDCGVLIFRNVYLMRKRRKP